MRLCSRLVLIALISCGMLALPIQPSTQAAPGQAASQANGSPFAVVVLADSAHVAGANAAAGTTVYPGDALDTAPGGEFRLTVAGGQVYLLSDTAANLGRSGAVLQATILRGTVGFSSLTDEQFQIETPEGIVEALHGPAYGQVTMTGAKDIVISAYTGTLVLHRGNQTLVVKAGQSYYVSLVPDSTPPDKKHSVYPGYAYHLEWRIIVVGTAAGIGYWLWRWQSESPTDPK